MQTIARIPTSSGTAELTDEAKDHLFKKLPAEVLSLPGAAQRSRVMGSWRGPVHHSPVMKKLVESGMFQRFNFLVPVTVQRAVAAQAETSPRTDAAPPARQL